MKGVGATWLMFAFGVTGTLFPDLLAQDWLDDRSLVRWIAIPLLFASSVLLISYYTRIF